MPECLLRNLPSNPQRGQDCTRVGMPPGFKTVGKLIGDLVGADGLSSAADKSRAAAAQEQARRAIAQGKSVTNLTADGEHVDFWKQGDDELNTADAFHRRFALRKDPLVRKSLHSIWEATLRSIQSSDKSSTRLRFAGYKLLFTRVYRVLIDDYDPADAEECILEDWDADRKGADSLTREQLCDSLFELTDHCAWPTAAAAVVAAADNACAFRCTAPVCTALSRRHPALLLPASSPPLHGCRDGNLSSISSSSSTMIATICLAPHMRSRRDIVHRPARVRALLDDPPR